jgi:mycofactocin precursor
MSPSPSSPAADRTVDRTADPTTGPAAGAPVDPTAGAPVIAAESLVEEVSIDGMCGVY